MRIERTPVLDEYAEDGVSVVMLPDGRVLALSELATAVLDLVDSTSLGLAELAEGLVSVFGPPPGDPAGTSTTRDIVSTMSGSGMLKVLTF